MGVPRLSVDGLCCDVKRRKKSKKPDLPSDRPLAMPRHRPRLRRCSWMLLCNLHATRPVWKLLSTLSPNPRPYWHTFRFIFLYLGCLLSSNYANAGCIKRASTESALRNSGTYFTTSFRPPEGDYRPKNGFLSLGTLPWLQLWAVKGMKAWTWRPVCQMKRIT